MKHRDYLKALIVLLFIANTAYAQKWSFAAVADPRAGFADFKRTLTELKRLSMNPDPKMFKPEFVLVNGDFDPAEMDFKIFNEVFPPKSDSSSLFLPVLGNHDLDYEFFIKEKMINNKKIFKKFSESSFSYYTDIKNCRVIVVDQYNGTGFNSGCINEAGKKWVEEKIRTSKADHIFIAFHEPAFPRVRHFGNSFDQCTKERDEFWNMLLKYKSKVRAVLVGHTHSYYKMKIADVKGDANDKNKYPIEEGGIYQFDAGGAGNSEDGTVTAIQFLVDNKNVTARVIQSGKGEKNFKVLETIEIN